MGKYELYHDTIDKMLRQIAKGQRHSDYAMIPQKCYEDWKKLRSFRDEQKKSKLDKDGKTRTYLTANFTDDNYCAWAIDTTDCSNPQLGSGWRYVIEIRLNNVPISHTKLDIVEFQSKKSSQQNIAIQNPKNL